MRHRPTLFTLSVIVIAAIAATGGAPRAFGQGQPGTTQQPRPQSDPSQSTIPWDGTTWSGRHAAAFESFITDVGQMNRKQDSEGFHLFEPDSMEKWWARVNTADIHLPSQDWQVVYAATLVCYHKNELLDHEESARIPMGTPLSPEVITARDNFASEHEQLYQNTILDIKQAIAPQSFASLDAYVFQTYLGNAKKHRAKPHSPPTPSGVPAKDGSSDGDVPR